MAAMASSTKTSGKTLGKNSTIPLLREWAIKGRRLNMNVNYGAGVAWALAKQATAKILRPFSALSQCKDKAATADGSFGSKAYVAGAVAGATAQQQQVEADDFCHDRTFLWRTCVTISLE